MIYGFGKACIDYICTVDSYPAENTANHIKAYKKTVGGMVANALRVCSFYGEEVKLFSVVGNTTESDWLIDKLEQEKIDMSAVSKVGDISFSFIVNTGHNRTIYHYPSGSKQHSWKDVKVSFCEDDIVIFDCTVLTGLEEVLHAAKDSGARIVMDVSPTNDAEGINDVLPYVDFCIPSKEWAEHFTGERDFLGIYHELHSKGIESLIITDGENGINIVHNDTLSHYPAPLVKVVDSNGAGDTFHGCFLWALKNDYNVVDASLIALVCASEKCKSIGLIEALPSLDDLLGKYRQYCVDGDLIDRQDPCYRRRQLGAGDSEV